MFIIQNNNCSLIFKHEYLLTKHKKKRHHKKKPDASVTDVDFEKEDTTTKPNETKANDEQKAMLKDVDIHTQHTEINVENEIIKEPRKVKSRDVLIHRYSVITFDGVNLEFNEEDITEEDINDQMQEAIVIEDVGDRSNNFSRRNSEVVADVTTEKNQPQTESINNTKEQSEPILEYANEPLLSLAEACAPLADILHDLDLYVKIALDETPEQPSNGLTNDESAAIRLYTIEWSGGKRSLYSMLNYTLKSLDREHLRPYFKYMKLFVTALVKLPCVPPCTVWRGVTKNLSVEFPPGTPVTWWAFSSCTAELTVLENNMYLGDAGSRTLFSVEVINGRTIRDHSHFVTEDELLLLPGTHMIVQSQFSPAPDLYIIHLKQVIPEEFLLASPFEGIFLPCVFIYFKSKYFFT
jgi:hypothetical protein